MFNFFVEIKNETKTRARYCDLSKLFAYLISHFRNKANSKYFSYRWLWEHVLMSMKHRAQEEITKIIHYFLEDFCSKLTRELWYLRNAHCIDLTEYSLVIPSKNFLDLVLKYWSKPTHRVPSPSEFLFHIYYVLNLR